MITSRVANVEAHVKLWAVLPLFLLYLALDKRRTVFFALTGIALSLALITYDTLAPMIGLVFFLFFVEVVRVGKGGIAWVKGFIAMLVPVAIVGPTVTEYLIGRGAYYNLASEGWAREPIQALFENLSTLLTNIFISAKPDFLFVRQGPLLESPIAPFFVMGVVLALVRLRERGALLLFSWFLIFTFPVPVALETPMFRVLYPGWPAYYGLAAIAVVLVGAVLVRPLISGRLYYLGLFVAGSLLFVNNLYVYLYELEDPQDRVYRRTATELVSDRVAAGDVVNTPYLPSSGHI